ncbi:hypothetical protein Cpin_7132 [Chitinophaga pinensis DSM 2588]|uniref:Uncharacterized protein n=1 Tax=Chitinophaga pinensis (strain ATCC 43595 / DSM 2588 / LMG 13176 / NBRC 15968 / NCIMB 11800 / UQM 2034) TaxID=485918 RepID=A0A979GXB0_CHIPD|nr:hypothetical protein Cpin_7132 [Chitinophaga pinensis DSM 2588]
MQDLHLYPGHQLKGFHVINQDLVFVRFIIFTIIIDVIMACNGDSSRLPPESLFP